MQDFYVTKNGEFEFFSGKINIKYKAYPIFIIHESLYKYYWDKLKRLLHQSKTKRWSNPYKVTSLWTKINKKPIIWFTVCDTFDKYSLKIILFPNRQMFQIFIIQMHWIQKLWSMDNHWIRRVQCRTRVGVGHRHLYLYWIVSFFKLLSVSMCQYLYHIQYHTS
jgi:hypothetical protein